MVISCWVKDCSNRADSTIRRSFYGIPAIRKFEGDQTEILSDNRRRVWLSSINRKDTPSKYSKICSDHFIKGKPADLYDQGNPDWAPTLLLSNSISPKSTSKKASVETNLNRYSRVQERSKTRIKHDVARALLNLYNEPAPIPEIMTPSVCDHQRCTFTLDGQMEQFTMEPPLSVQINQSQIDSDIQRLLTENITLKSELKACKLTQEGFINQDEKVKYYSGLPNYATLLALFQFVSPFMSSPRNASELGLFERFIMTLMRLKLNLSIQDLSYRFGTSSSTVSRTFITVINVLYWRLRHLLYWPNREELHTTMPLEFRKHFGKKTAVIIDCFEVFIQRPKNLKARAQTWSSYKHNNTAKFLIGITPQGTISFLSKAWGGRASDKFITERCGLLNKLLPGDLVLADRGFDIADSIGMCCAEVNIPSFTKGRSQLSPVDIETTRKIAHVRIHVERVIGLVRNKYTILQGKLPIDFLKSGGQRPIIDKIATVVCALTNMCESVVSFN